MNSVSAFAIASRSARIVCVISYSVFTIVPRVVWRNVVSSAKVGLAVLSVSSASRMSALSLALSTSPIDWSILDNMFAMFSSIFGKSLATFSRIDVFEGMVEPGGSSGAPGVPPESSTCIPPMRFPISSMANVPSRS